MIPEINILELIPQRPPFVMVDALTGCDETSASSTFTVAGTNLFVAGQRLGEPALIENIAQTAAARVGYICWQEKKEVPVGFIGAIQNFELAALPHTGDILNTEITIKNQIFNATLISGSIKVGEKLIATCDMKIFIS